MESTARAERYDLQSGVLPAYTWEVPQKPVVVRIPYPVIDKLEGEAVDNFRSLNARGSEIGGVLFGKASSGEPILVSVEGYELIVCDYSRGPLYRLSDADLARFDKVIAQHSSGAAVVGFFRSHTRKGLTLDAEDLALFESRFKDPRKVGMLIRPFATKASTAGFFIWEGGSVHSESSYLEFPCRSSQLVTFKPAEVADPGLAAHGLGGGALPTPSVPRAAARAQIVPIASRRDGSVASAAAAVEAPEAKAVEVAPPAAPEVSAAPAAAPVAAPAPAPTPAPQAAAAAPVAPPEAPKTVAAEPVAPVETPAVKVETTPSRPANPPWNKSSSRKGSKNNAEAAAKAAIETPEKPAAEPVKPVEKALEKVVEKALFEKAAEEVALEPARSNKLIWIAVGAIVPLILMVVLFIYPGVLRRGTKTPTTAGFDTSALSLRVERTGGELQLSWNRDSDPIRNATKGVLSISDGTQHQDVDLDLAQLQKGSIAYTPATGDVVFRMEVTAKGQGKTASEMVRALSTRPSPLAQDPTAATPSSTAAKTPEPAAAAAAPAATPADAPPVEEEAAKAPQRTLKPFRAESLSARLHPAPATTDLPDAPSLGRVDGSGVSVSALNMNSVATPVAPPKAAPAVPVAPPLVPEKKAQAGGQIQQAVLIHRKEPEYPRLARETGAKGMVELTATIGADGKVKKVTPIKGHPMLVRAASDAVMQWTYKPTVLNGVAVEATTQVVINFMGDK